MGIGCLYFLFLPVGMMSKKIKLYVRQTKIIAARCCPGKFRSDKIKYGSGNRIEVNKNLFVAIGSFSKKETTDAITNEIKKRADVIWSNKFSI